MDKDYWKEAYKEFWETSSRKEEFIKGLIEKNTGFKVLDVGLGAGTQDFLSGSAADYGLEKGDADLYVVEADTYVEVTGPNIPVNFHDKLWIRPDKVKNSHKKFKQGKGKLHVIIHIAKIKPDGHQIMRVIVMRDPFWNACIVKEFPIIYPKIRGREERYLELPPEHEVIVTFDKFIELLKQAAE